ncbi:hypothetical protein [Rhodopila sp.]|uniref:hypothetical protein n=1 Tax=Rhodopila sp. TaxID=2480087 RepID=UPI003D09B424
MSRKDDPHRTMPAGSADRNYLPPRHVTVALTFDAGIDRLDSWSIGLMAAALEAGAVISSEFATMADALRCEAKLCRLAGT